MYRWILFTLVLCACNQIFQREPDRSEAIELLMAHCHENGMFNGTILVAKGEDVIYRKAFGVANRAKNEPLTPETPFYLASVSKQFTTMGIMILKEKGLLTYDDRLTRFFPDFPDYGKEVTIRQMMTHTSGIPDHYGLGAYKKDLKNQDVYALLKQQESLDFPSGEKYSYSNGGYVLLAMIIEQVSGQPLHKFMKANVFDVLAMNSTLVYDESKPEISSRAIGYYPSGDIDDYEILTTGAGGMYSNVDDLHQWHLGLLSEKIVSQSSLQEAYIPTQLNDGEYSNYGFGWGVDTLKNTVQHSGGLNGFRTYIKRFLGTKEVYILLTNHGGAFRLNEISEALDHILVDDPFMLPKPPLSQRIKNLLGTSTIEATIEQAKTLKANDEVEVDEYGINALGLQFLRKEDFPEAIAILELNTELFPNSSNTFDSYGEALLKKGDTTVAIANYRQSIVLNPNNEYGISVLENLGMSRDELLPNIQVDSEVLDSYVGDYKLREGFILTILREGDQLFIHPSGQNQSEIYAASENRFYSKTVNAQITFNSNENGEVEGLTLYQGGDYEAPKVK